MTVRAIDVATELRIQMPGLGVKKLHKLLYFCQGHHLAVFGQPLFQESISAWDMGPVVGSLWYQEKAGEGPVIAEELTEAELNTVGYVLSRYGALTAKDLELLTHAQDPWRDANELRPTHSSIRIPTEALTSYFLLSADEEDDESSLPDAEELRAWLAEAGGRDSSVPGSADSPDEIRSRLRVGA